MDISIKQISSLDKVRRNGPVAKNDLWRRTAMAGERVSYQLHVRSDIPLILTTSVESELSDHIRLYQVRDAVMDVPLGRDVPQEDYITLEPGLMPDILVPMEQTGNQMTSDAMGHTVWVKVDIPKDAKPGFYYIKVKFDAINVNGAYVCTCCQHSGRQYGKEHTYGKYSCNCPFPKIP